MSFLRFICEEYQVLKTLTSVRSAPISDTSVPGLSRPVHSEQALARQAPRRS
jgi:hypothetical protein